VIKIQYIGLKEKGKSFRVVSSENFKKELNELPNGRYRITVDKYRKNKSNPQLGYLFAGVYPLVLKALNDAGWEFTSVDEVDEYCKSMFSSREVLNRHTGEILDIPGLKRDMTTTEMMTYVEAIRDWASEYLNVYIPEPESQIDFSYENPT
jgi:hypothetical protein